MSDRTVHASNSVVEVCRYDRAGKWYIEGNALAGRLTQIELWEDKPLVLNSRGREHVTVDEAAMATVWLDLDHQRGRVGGGAFDARVEHHRTALHATTEDTA